MAISVTPNYEYTRQTMEGALLNEAKLVVTGLTADAANTIPHGLPRAPLNVIIEPTSAGGFFETQAADAANVYVTASGAGTTVNLYVEY